MNKKWAGPQLQSWSCSQDSNATAFPGVKCKHVQQPSGCRHRDVRCPLWNMGNNKNYILYSSKSDNHTDCKTCKHRALENLQGVLCACSAFSRTRLICSYFSQLKQSKWMKERKESELSVLLKRLMVSHTLSQVPHHSLADLRTGVPPTAELRAWQAPGNPRSPVFSHTLQQERPVWASLNTTEYLDAR